MVIIMKKVIETNVSFDDVRNKYIVKIKRNRAEFRYDADSLDEAKSVKSRALDFMQIMIECQVELILV